MITQGELYDLIEENMDHVGVEDAAYLFANKHSKKKIRGTLQIQYRTAEGFDLFREALLESTNCKSIVWNRNTPQLVTQEGEKVKITDFDVNDHDQVLAEVLLEMYREICLEQKIEDLTEKLVSGEISQSSRIIAAIARQRKIQRNRRKVDGSFLWKVFELVNDNEFERNARNDIMNELVRSGCIVKDGSDIYVRPALDTLPEEENYLPDLIVSDNL